MPNCPREQGVMTFLEGLDVMETLPQDIHYKQWVTVDRCSLIEKIENISDFIQSLSMSISNLIKHHYTSKCQAEYFKNFKNNLSLHEGCLVGDFAENFSFIVQDAAQGFHWENSQCTIHPFVFYWKQHDNVYHQSYCFISDSLKHNTVMVYSFLQELIPTICAEHPNLTKIHYFTDGCAAQYKNKFNFLNFCHHKADFGIDAEWNFFATSHGKNACDGIGGTVKRAAAKASLQRHVNHQILTAEDVFNFCTNIMNSSIKFLFTSSMKIKEIGEILDIRFNVTIQSIVGTLKFHRFVPVSMDSLMVYRHSQTTKKELHRLLKDNSNPSVSKNYSRSQEKTDTEIKVGCFVGCIYGQELWFGLAKDYDTEYEDYIINFLYPSGIAPSYTFPTKEDICPIAKDNILGAIQARLRGGTRIQYVFQEEDMDNFAKEHLKRCT